MDTTNNLDEFFANLCQDLNLDNEIRFQSFETYQSLKKHYILEGNQLHWLAISLFVNCKQTEKQNPFCLTRLFQNLKTFHLIEFFDKLHKWIDMLNLPNYLQNSILNIEHQFNISSIIYKKYLNIFEQLFVCSKEKLIEFNYRTLKNDFQLNQKYKQKKLNSFYLYQFIWTIYSLLKCIYPLTSNDLISSYHLLLSSNLFIYQLIQKQTKLNHLIQHEQFLIEHFCQENHCEYSILNSIIEEYIQNIVFEQICLNIETIDENKFFEFIRQINMKYDEIILTNCFLDQRIFLEKSSNLNDFCSHLNENHDKKSLENKTPLTAQQHLTFFNSNSEQQHLTPISQANQLISLLNLIIEKPTNLIDFVQQQTYLDDLTKRLNEYEEIFLKEFQSNENQFSFHLNQIRFRLCLKFFFVTLQNIFIIENKRLIQIHLNQSQIYQTFQKLILTNEFIKSLLGLCLLLVLYSYGDLIHDLNWMLNIYSLNGYSLLKIIQILLKSTKEINQSRVFIKYLSTIEETILSSMIFENRSLLWNDIQTKGIPSYQHMLSKQMSSSPSPNANLILNFRQSSPNSNQIKRKLFDHDDDDDEHSLTIVRTQSDNSIERNPMKSSPYTMFYKKFYTLVYRRIHSIALRLSQSNDLSFEIYIWNLFLYLFQNYTTILFRSRHLDQIILLTFYYSFNSNLIPSKQQQQQQQQQLTWNQLIHIYRSMPNSNVNLTRSVFICQSNTSDLTQLKLPSNHDPYLTPSKLAGTIHLIDNAIYGDITSFYREIFLKIENIDKNIDKYFQETPLNSLPSKLILNNHSKHSSFSISCGRNLFVDYSSTNQQIKKNLFSYSNQESFQDKSHSNSNNILSSSVQVGSTNTVQTTTQRTSDGKFLTTISTSYQSNQQPQQQQQQHANTNQFKFGRTFSDFNSNSLNSLTKKVLQIENDRQSSLPN